MAAQNGHLRAAELLIGAGANLERARLSDNTTPLMRAAYNGHEQLAKALVQAGAEMEKKDRNGYTAFQTAMYTQHQAVVDVLVEAGCKTDDPWPGSKEDAAHEKKSRRQRVKDKKKFTGYNEQRGAGT